MNRIACLLAAIAALALATGAYGLDTATRPVGPVMSWGTQDLERFSDAWVHVKFVEGSDVVTDGRRFQDASGLDLASVQSALDRADIVEIRPTFDHDRATLRAWKQIAETRSGVTGPDLSLWYSIRVGGGRPAVARLVNDLNASRAVEIAHPEPHVENAVIETSRPDGALIPPSPATPDFTGQQGYLYEAPTGLDAPEAWAIPGGNGAGNKFIDVELCWTEDHEDFPFARLFYVGGAAQDPQYETHGTAVLGEVIGQQNGFGVNGFAHGVDAYGVVAVTVAEWPTVPHYFQEAIDHLSAGDVWLIELQMYPPGKGATPMEWLQVNYDVIWTGVWARNVVCIEAGANGSQNLDDASWGGVFNRNVRDSGAIMCAAGTPTGLVAEWFTNYGSRMDVHAWGSSIVTTGYGDLYNGGTLQTKYTAQFSGTSGASPMATGAALCIQGIARAATGGIPFTPIQLRTILHDTGTAYQGTKIIGPRPDLERAVPLALQMAASTPEAHVEVRALSAGPNPFNQATQIRLDLQRDQVVRVRLLDATGRNVRTLMEGPAAAGRVVLSWDGRDDAGNEARSGVYFLRVDETGDGSAGTIKIQKVR